METGLLLPRGNLGIEDLFMSREYSNCFLMRCCRFDDL
jgi:hypothetical protein